MLEGRVYHRAKARQDLVELRVGPFRCFLRDPPLDRHFDELLFRLAVTFREEHILRQLPVRNRRESSLIGALDA
ncbi:hypothetical protein D3C74_444130 [compost metagenome]